MEPLKLISVNIEGHKHLDLVLPFLRTNNPDVVCLQEVHEPDFGMLANVLGMKGRFSPMTLMQLDRKTGPHIPLGIGICTSLPFSDVREQYYYGTRKKLHTFAEHTTTVYSRALTSLVATKKGTAYTVGTTHFTWTANGLADAHQRRDIRALLRTLRQFPEIVFCGDFNAPRGGEIFGELARRYADNIPARYNTSIDGARHYGGPLAYMVDGLFTTPAYHAANVRLVSGVSDHCAIVADIYRAD